MAIRLTGMTSGLDTDSMVQELVSAYSTKLENYKKQKTKVEWTQDKWADLNTKIYGFYTGSLSSLRMSSSFSNKKKVTVSDPAKATVTGNSQVTNGTQTLKIKQLAKASYLTGSKLSTASGEEITSRTLLSDLGITFTPKETESEATEEEATAATTSLTLTVGGEEKTVELTSDMTVSDFVSVLKEQGLNANFDTTQQRFFISATTSGKEADFSFDTQDAQGLNIMSSLGLTTSKDGGTAVKQDGQNAIIELNGAQFEGATNQFSINGLSITATGVTGENDTISILTQTDTDGIYDMVKNFLTDYNNIINELTENYNADSAKGYDPLTDDEKDAMSDSEVEKWEDKIKKSLLRRDDTLSSIISAMNASMQKGIEINGKTYNLSTFGIHTQSILSAKENTQNAFHIDGDSGDSATADSADKLRKMIESDPDTVTEFFNQMAKNLYNNLTDKMKSTTLSSAYTVYNDKSLKDDLKDIEDSIDKWEDKVSDYEEMWYKKFSAMETALAKLQSSTSSITSLLGGN